MDREQEDALKETPEYRRQQMEKLGEAVFNMFEIVLAAHSPAYVVRTMSCPAEEGGMHDVVVMVAKPEVAAAMAAALELSEAYLSGVRNVPGFGSADAN